MWPTRTVLMALMAFGAFFMGTFHGQSAYRAEEVLSKSMRSPVPPGSWQSNVPAPPSTRKLEGQQHHKEKHAAPHHLKHRSMIQEPQPHALQSPPPATVSSSPAEAGAAPVVQPQPAAALPSLPSHGNKVAICLGFTSRVKGQSRVKQAVLGLKGQSPLFQDLVPSLCETMSHGFTYSLWIGYDQDDPILSIQGAPELVKSELEHHVPGCKFDVHMVKVSSSGSPTWAQNDAVLSAHKAGMDFFYRVNDDSVMSSSGWTEKFISALAAMNPPYVGVVGPTHKGGNLRILTYDFTSRKHVDIFGFHYPRAFPTWWGDDWITLVYQPDNMKKLPDVSLLHKVEDIRYVVGEDKAKLGTLQREVDLNKEKLQKWIKAHPSGR